MGKVPPTIPLPRGWSSHVKSGLLHAVSLARVALTDVRSGFENSPLLHARQAAELDRWRAEAAQLAEENRILRARLAHVPPAKRPHYPPVERLAILEHRSAHGLNLSETGRRFQITRKTIQEWMRRVDEAGEHALLETPEPVNRFPDFVAALVQRLKATLPSMGRVRIAQTLGRAGLHLAPSTARRLLRRPIQTPPPAPKPDTSSAKSGEGEPPAAAGAKRVVSARYPHQLWQIDLTVVPTAAGFWISFFPFSLPVGWPFCWWVAAVFDHFSRAVVAKRAFASQPSAADIVALLDSAVRAAGRAPRHAVTDQGSQFQTEYRDWCKRHGSRPRFGAIGEHGSIAVFERFWLSMKEECFRKILVPFSLAAMDRALDQYVTWYLEARPHQSLAGRTPREVLDGAHPAHRFPRVEPRARYPTGAPCASPRVPVRGKRGAKLQLLVTHPQGAPHLPAIELRRAA